MPRVTTHSPCVAHARRGAAGPTTPGQPLVSPWGKDVDVQFLEGDGVGEHMDHGPFFQGLSSPGYGDHGVRCGKGRLVPSTQLWSSPHLLQAIR